MEKQTKTLLGLGAIAVVLYLILKPKKSMAADTKVPPVSSPEATPPPRVIIHDPMPPINVTPVTPDELVSAPTHPTPPTPPATIVTPDELFD
jgi:hypothetical protein